MSVTTPERLSGRVTLEIATRCPETGAITPFEGGVLSSDFHVPNSGEVVARYPGDSTWQHLSLTSAQTSE